MRLLCIVFTAILLSYSVYAVWWSVTYHWTFDATNGAIHEPRRLSNNRTETLIDVKNDIVKQFRNRAENSWCFDYDDTLFFTTPVFQQFQREYNAWLARR